MAPHVVRCRGRARRCRSRARGVLGRCRAQRGVRPGAGSTQRSPFEDGPGHCGRCACSLLLMGALEPAVLVPITPIGDPLDDQAFDPTFSACRVEPGALHLAAHDVTGGTQCVAEGYIVHQFIAAENDPDAQDGELHVIGMLQRECPGALNELVGHVSRMVSVRMGSVGLHPGQFVGEDCLGDEDITDALLALVGTEGDSRGNHDLGIKMIDGLKSARQGVQ